MLGLQPSHLILILVVALIIFGPKQLPELGKAVGQAIAEFKRATMDEVGKASASGAPAPSPQPALPQTAVGEGAEPEAEERGSEPA